MNEEDNFRLTTGAGEAMDIQIYQEQLADDQISIKYSKLVKKCEQIKMENFRLINYIDQINKLVRKVRKQNVFIANKLDQNNDDYHKPSILQEIELVINYGKTKLRKESTSKVGKLSNNKTKMDEKCSDLTGDHRNKRIKVENNRTTAEDSHLILASGGYHLSTADLQSSTSLASPSSNLSANLVSLLPSNLRTYPITTTSNNSINSFGNSTGALVWQEERSG